MAVPTDWPRVRLVAASWRNTTRLSKNGKLGSWIDDRDTAWGNHGANRNGGFLMKRFAGRAKFLIGAAFWCMVSVGRGRGGGGGGGGGELVFSVLRRRKKRSGDRKFDPRPPHFASQDRLRIKSLSGVRVGRRWTERLPRFQPGRQMGWPGGRAHPFRFHINAAGTAGRCVRLTVGILYELRGLSHLNWK